MKNQSADLKDQNVDLKKHKIIKDFFHLMEEDYTPMLLFFIDKSKDGSLYNRMERLCRLRYCEKVKRNSTILRSIYDKHKEYYDGVVPHESYKNISIGEVMVEVSLLLADRYNKRPEDILRMLLHQMLIRRTDFSLESRRFLSYKIPDGQDKYKTSKNDRNWTTMFAFDYINYNFDCYWDALTEYIKQVDNDISIIDKQLDSIYSDTVYIID